MVIFYLFLICVSAAPIDDNKNILDEWYDHIINNKTDSLTKTNPEELGSIFEGDMIMKIPKTGLINKNYRWPNNIVPYIFSEELTEEYAKKIEDVMKEFQRKTCLRFRRKLPTDIHYIHFKGEQTGCWSYVGCIGQNQTLNLQIPACLYYKGTIMHEIMHALGFYHEQSNPKRDSRVTILYQNIIPEYRYAFDKLSSDVVTSFGVPYDYESVMHYSAYAFSANERPTIVAKKKNARLGQRDGFGPGDLIKINKMYKCF